MSIDLHKVEAIFFDLDDTLLDTATLVIPTAVEHAAVAMVDVGLAASVSDLARFLRKQAEAGCGLDYFGSAVRHFAVVSESGAAIAAAGRRAHLTAEAPVIELLPGARELLETLRWRCRLFLVTAGDPTTQRAKIRRLDIGDVFDVIRWVSSIDCEDKLDAMRDLLIANRPTPQRCVCIGDRMVGEIRCGNLLGMQTVLLARGEFRAMDPVREEDVPDYSVLDMRDLAGLLGVELPESGPSAVMRRPRRGLVTDPKSGADRELEGDG